MKKEGERKVLKGWKLMEIQKIADAEYRLMELVWEKEPINSTALVKLSLEKLGWKKATTYTVIRKLCEKGILKNENAVVEALVKKEEIQKQESEALLKKSFGNSLPAFVAAFLRERKLTDSEAQELRQLIDRSVNEEK